jgi:hypothetical protein
VLDDSLDAAFEGFGRIVLCVQISTAQAVEAPLARAPTPLRARELARDVRPDPQRPPPVTSAT